MGWYSTVQVLYGVPSFLLMIIFWGLFAVGKPFKHPFYRLLQFDLLINITGYLNSWFGIRFREWEMGVEVLIWTESCFPGWQTLSNFLLVWYCHLQCASSILLCIYRLTAVMFIHSEEMWERHYFLAIISSFLYSICVLMPVFFLGGFAEKITVQDGKLHTEYDMDQVKVIYAMNPFFAMFYFIIITTSGFGTVFFIEKTFRAVNTRSNLTKTFVQKMTVVTLINSAMVAGNLFFAIASGIFMAFEIEIVSASFISVVMAFTSDMMTFALPYILLGNDYKIQTALKLCKPIALVRPIEQTHTS